MFDNKSFEIKMQQALEHFEDELKKVRAGRAHPSMLESVQVEAYGVKVPINQVANITVAEATQLVVTPFDPSNIEAISGAIRNDPSLGFNPSDDGRVVRVPVPPLTEERRREIVKNTSEKLEDTRVVIRNVRQDALKDIKRQKDAKELSEDDSRGIEKDIDRITREYTDRAEEVFKSKEKDILTI